MNSGRECLIEEKNVKERVTYRGIGKTTSLVCGTSGIVKGKEGVIDVDYSVVQIS